MTTPNLALVRLHGRNHATWNQKGLNASERFNYDYSTGELTDLANNLRRIAEEVEAVDALFNNNYED